MTMRLYIDNPVVVFRARVNMATITYPVAEIDFDTVSVGAYTDLEPGMTIILSGSAFGLDDHGRQRIRKAATSSKIYVGRSSQGAHDGELNVSDNDFIEVIRDYRVWSKIPFIASDGEVRKDWDIVFDGHTNESPPVANCGPDMAGTATGGSTLLRVQLPPVANTSQPTADGVAITDYLWSLPSGVTLVGGYALTDDIIQVDCNPGFYYVSLTVTDANGKTHTSRCRIYARNPASDTSIDNFQIVSHRITPAGQQIGIRVLDDIPASTYPDGTAVMLWEGEPSGPTDRSHMRFSGWHHTDPATILSERTGIVRDTVFECLDVAGKLTTLPGFSGHVDNASSPDNWLQMKDANIDKYLHYLLNWHSSALELADFTWSNIGSLFPFVTLGSQDASLFEQVNKRASSIVPNHLFTCNTLGQMAIKPDPMVTQTADRTSTVQATLTEDDWSSIEYTHQRSPRFHWLRGSAILAHATEIQPIFCDSPGEAPGQGLTATPHGEQLAMTQDDLNESEGNRYARLNAPEAPFNIRLVSANGGADFGIEPAAMTWVELTLSAAYAAQRGLSFTEARFLPLELNITYQYERSGLVRDTVLTAERETVGVPAVTYIQPPAPPPAPSPPPYDDTPVIVGQGDGFGTNYVVVDAAIGRTRDLSASSPSWSDISPTDSNAFYDFVLDSHRPKTDGYLTSDSGVWKSTNLNQAVPSWSLALTAAQVQTALSATTFGEAYHVLTSINVPDYVAVFFTATVSGTKYVYCGYSTDAGASWAYGQVGVPAVSGVAGWAGAVDYVPHLVGGQVRIYCCIGIVGFSTQPRMFRSDDGGANWSNVGDLVITLAGQNTVPFSCHVPFNDNATGSTVYVCCVGGSGHPGLHQSTDSGATWSRLITTSTAAAHRFNAETWTQDKTRGFFWQASPSAFALLTTSNSFTSTSPAANTGLVGSNVFASGGFPYQNSQFYAVTNSGIFVTIDRGENWLTKTGDWAMGFTNPRVIVPLWVSE